MSALQPLLSCVFMGRAPESLQFASGIFRWRVGLICTSDGSLAPSLRSLTDLQIQRYVTLPCGCKPCHTSMPDCIPLFSLSSAENFLTSWGFDPVPGMCRRQIELDFMVIPLACITIGSNISFIKAYVSMPTGIDINEVAYMYSKLAEKDDRAPEQVIWCRCPNI